VSAPSPFHPFFVSSSSSSPIFHLRRRLRRHLLLQSFFTASSREGICGARPEIAPPSPAGQSVLARTPGFRSAITAREIRPNSIWFGSLVYLRLRWAWPEFFGNARVGPLDGGGGRILSSRRWLGWGVEVLDGRTGAWWRGGRGGCGARGTLDHGKDWNSNWRNEWVSEWVSEWVEWASERVCVLLLLLCFCWIHPVVCGEWNLNPGGEKCPVSEGFGRVVIVGWWGPGCGLLVARMWFVASIFGFG
jgi:hypothetical protein